MSETMNQESERLLREYVERQREQQREAEQNRYEGEFVEPKSFAGLVEDFFRNQKVKYWWRIA